MLHAQVPPRLLPAELGGEGGEYHAHTWASTMLNYIPNQQNDKSKQNITSTKTTQVQTPTDTPTPSYSPKTSSITDALYKSSTANTTIAASQNTPLVNKVDNVARTTSFASLLFGKNDSDTATNGNVSEGEDAALKAH